eukprot:6028971-Amphidinium_carterae.1
MASLAHCAASFAQRHHVTTPIAEHDVAWWGSSRKRELALLIPAGTLATRAVGEKFSTNMLLQNRIVSGQTVLETVVSTSGERAARGRGWGQAGPRCSLHPQLDSGAAGAFSSV